MDSMGKINSKFRVRRFRDFHQREVLTLVLGMAAAAECSPAAVMIAVADCRSVTQCCELLALLVSTDVLNEGSWGCLHLSDA